MVGSWRLVAAGGWRRLVVGGWWRLAVDGSWRLAVGGPLGLSLRAVLSKKKKKSRPLRTPLYTNVVGCSVKILHSELFPGSSAVLVLFSRWVLYKQVHQMVMEWYFFLFVARFIVSTCWVQIIVVQTHRKIL